MFPYDQGLTHKVLGKKFREVRVEDSSNKRTPHLKIYTGVKDIMDDEIVLTVLLDEGVVTDDGYTEYVLESIGIDTDLNKARLLIKAYDVELSNTYSQTLRINFDGGEYMEAVNKLTFCIVDIYAGLAMQLTYR